MLVYELAEKKYGKLKWKITGYMEDRLGVHVVFEKIYDNIIEAKTDLEELQKHNQYIVHYILSMMKNDIRRDCSENTLPQTYKKIQEMVKNKK